MSYSPELRHLPQEGGGGSAASGGKQEVTKRVL